MNKTFLDLIGPEGMQPGELKVVEYRGISLSTVPGRRSLPDGWLFRLDRLDKSHVVIYRAKPDDNLKCYPRATIVATAMDKAMDTGELVKIDYWPWERRQVTQSICEYARRTGRKYRKGLFSKHCIVEFDKEINTRWVKYD